MDAVIALLALGTGVVVLATAIVTLILSLKNRTQVQKVHVLVNSQRVEMKTRIDQLIELLRASGVDIPPPSEHPESKET